MHEIGRPLQLGDKAPSCYGMAPGRQFYSFEEQYGRPVVLLLVGADAASGLEPVFAEFAAARSLFHGRNTDLNVIVDDNPAGVFGHELTSMPLRVIDCGNFLQRCGVGPSNALVLVLDRNLRIALRLPPAEGSVQACLACLDGLPAEAPRDVSMPAPAIVLPNLITRDFCRHLIAMFEASPSVDGGVARVDAAGNAHSVVDHTKKQRRDMMIGLDNPLYQNLHDMLLKRCVPEIAKAFQAKVAYLDRILLSRYSDTGGWFRRHRDNVADNVAFREFALSLNLNTGDYDGGHLLFPEYNDNRYSPPAGGGIIFSSSVLHEATPVTRGQRYVLLTFFHGEDAERRRQALEAKAAQAILLN